MNGSPAGDALDGVTWLGHATAIVELGGARVLTDPVLTDRIAHLRRRRPLTVQRSVPVDAVVVTHVHVDHLHLRSLKLLDPGTVAVVPAGAGRMVSRTGLRDVVEVRPGEELEVAGVTIQAVPAMHKRSRGPHSRVEADPMGFVLRRGATSVYMAGDTDLFAGMADWAGVTAALLPIWGWGPSIGVGHLDPVRAAAATRLVDPTYVVPIHWGTLSPEDGRRRLPSWLDTPASEFAAALGEEYQGRLRLLMPGDRLDLTDGAVLGAGRLRTLTRDG